MVEPLRKIKEHYRSEGLTGLLKSAPRAAYTRFQIARHRRRGSNFYYQMIKEEGFDERWELIESHISPDRSVLDVGCNAGLFTEAAAEKGCFAVGLEKQSGTVRDAIKYHGGAPEFGLVTRPITEDTVTALPTFDYTFLFSVYHHIYRIQGQTAAENVLNTLAERTTETLFFEPASRKELYGDEELPFTDNDPGSILEYNEGMLERVIDGDVQVDHLGSRQEGVKTERHLLAIRMR